MNRRRRVSIRDVAENAGVSVATVSKVMNGYRQVSADAIERVERSAAELGYVSSLGARSLRSSRTGVLAVLVTEIEPYSAEVLKGASAAIGKTDYGLLVYADAHRRDTVGWEHRYLSAVGGTLVDGAVVVTPTSPTLTGGPVVAVDPHQDLSGVPTVAADNRAGAAAATRHLLELGHTRIAFLQGHPFLESARLREQGFRQAMQTAEVEVDPDLVRPGEYQADVAAVQVEALLDLAEPPTAIFAGNDLMGVAAIEVARGRGLDVPADLSVVGFDNVPEAALCDPPLTTIEQQLKVAGEMAITMLIGVVEGRSIEESVVLPTRLIDRSSTAPCAAGPG
jgi:LacI family transcriptional regulator